MIVGLICARAGSEGLKDKNLLKLGGKTLIEIAERKASDCPLIERVAVSTDIPIDGWDCSPDTFYVPRPAELCGPRTPKWDVWKHAAEWLPLDVTAIVDIDVTRPLTTVADIAGTIEAWRDTGLSVAAAWRGQAKPECDVLAADGYPANPQEGSRQEAPEYFGYGGIYVTDPQSLRIRDYMWPARYHVIPRAHCFDIDDALDWEIVQDQWRRQNRKDWLEVPLSSRDVVREMRIDLEARGCHNEYANTGGWK